MWVYGSGVLGNAESKDGVGLTINAQLTNRFLVRIFHFLDTIAKSVNIIKRIAELIYVGKGTF